MEYRQLGKTDLQVSALCLGTMTFGEQNTQDEAFGQLDHAIASGINFIDTAELYPVPGKAETGWLPAATGNRSLWHPRSLGVQTGWIIFVVPGTV